MAKYGNGISMKRAMEMDMAEVKAALDRSNISPDDRKAVIDTFKEWCHQIAITNASACAFEENVLNRDRELFFWAAKPENTAQMIQKKLQETYPEWDDEEEYE